MTIEITNNSVRGVAIWEPVFEDATLTFTGAETWPAGAVLGRLTATGAFARFNPAGADGSQIPKAVLTQEAVATAAGDIATRVAISGRIRAGDLVNNAGAALTAEQLDQLRDFSIVALSTTQLSQLDNQ